MSKCDGFTHGYATTFQLFTFCVLLRACQSTQQHVHGGGGPQVGEVTRLGGVKK